MRKQIEIDQNNCKPCSKCGKILPVEQNFHKDKGTATGYSNQCKKCCRKTQIESEKRVRERDPEAYKERRRQYGKTYKENHPEKLAETQKAARLKYRYKMTQEEYYNLFELQNGLCAICKKPPTEGRPLAVDHDHNCCNGRRSCGECVRGLLCWTCNDSMGKLENYLDNAKEYLSEYDRKRTDKDCFEM